MVGAERTCFWAKALGKVPLSLSKYMQGHYSVVLKGSIVLPCLLVGKIGTSGTNTIKLFAPKTVKYSCDEDGRILAVSVTAGWPFLTAAFYAVNFFIVIVLP